MLVGRSSLHLKALSLGRFTSEIRSQRHKSRTLDQEVENDTKKTDTRQQEKLAINLGR
jgi:hypothetical protein